MADMAERTELSFDDLHFDDLKDSLTEYALENTVKTDTYTGVFGDVKAFEEGGRQFGTVSTQLFDEEGNKLRKVNIKFSWERRFTSNGRTDTPFRNFSSLMKILEVTTPDPREVLLGLNGGSCKVAVSESYRVLGDDVYGGPTNNMRLDDEGFTWVRLAKDAEDDERNHYVALGYEPFTLVQGIYKLR